MDEGENCGTVEGELGHHVEVVADDDLPVQDVVVGVVASVDYPAAINNQSRRVAKAVGAGIRMIGGHSVVSNKLVFNVIRTWRMENDDATARAFHFGGDVNPAANGVQVLVLHLVRVNGDGIWQDWAVGVCRKFLATVQEGQGAH